MIKKVVTDAEVLTIFPVMQQLRLHLKEEEYLEVVRRLERSGYRLSFAAEGRGVRCVAGFRVVEFFGPRKAPLRRRPRDHRGRLFGGPRQADARPARWGGAGRGLWGPPADSGVTRHEAHRFSMREKVSISSYRFSKPV